MEKQNENMRDRLLARLPQPENLAAYRKETEVLLAKHKKALFWEKAPSVAFSLVALGFFIAAFSPWGQKLGARQVQFFDFDACLFFVVSLIIDLRYNIYRNRVELLKEVKQIQLQILELHASLNKTDENQP
ncbi:MAG: hypothetical protein ABSD59_22190 [Terracidiphilus sp.]|jgi:hypothetical protein